MPEKKLIFDNTVLSNFLIADAGSLLLERYKGRGVVSSEVYDELSAGIKKEPALHRVDLFLDENNFNLITMSKKEHGFYVSLLDSLGRGEASCIAYARNAHCVVASDDKAARKVCDKYKISYTGTIGILIVSCRDGQLAADVADRLLEKMVDAGFYSPVQRISDVM